MSARPTQAEQDASAVERIRAGLDPQTRLATVSMMKNGAQVGNRVHHAQGGILMGLAATTASVALPPTWALTGITSCFTSPGQGKAILARSKVVHHGLMTAVVRTEIAGPNARRVLETVTPHSRTIHSA